MNKVQGGTPKGSQSLCVMCRSAHNVVGVNMQRITICRAGNSFAVRFPVSECSVYDDKRNPAVWEMEKIAWEVHSRNRGLVGFSPDPERLDIVITPPDPNRNNTPGQAPAPALEGK
jgi:hypothetical protein